jgi:hypothetical protein
MDCMGHATETCPCSIKSDAFSLGSPLKSFDKCIIVTRVIHHERKDLQTIFNSYSTNQDKAYSILDAIAFDGIPYCISHILARVLTQKLTKVN